MRDILSTEPRLHRQVLSSGIGLPRVISMAMVTPTSSQPLSPRMSHSLLMPAACISSIWDLALPHRCSEQPVQAFSAYGFAPSAGLLTSGDMKDDIAAGAPDGDVTSGSTTYVDAGRVVVILFQ